MKNGTYNFNTIAIPNLSAGATVSSFIVSSFVEFNDSQEQNAVYYPTGPYNNTLSVFSLDKIQWQVPLVSGPSVNITGSFGNMTVSFAVTLNTKLGRMDRLPALILNANTSLITIAIDNFPYTSNTSKLAIESYFASSSAVCGAWLRSIPILLLYYL